MSILVTNKIKKDLRKRADIWLYISIFLGLFGRIYEQFSHEVYSMRLIYAFAYPLLIGCVLRIILLKVHTKYMMGYLSRNIYDCGIITLSLGAILEGILYIYGTASKYISYYYYVGAGLIVLAMVLFIIGIFTAVEEK